ncbi:hypothetical protein [Isoptericola dokdonensis]|nr:hypothetical protein [Isoptericola dokdonensis]
MVVLPSGCTAQTERAGAEVPELWRAQIDQVLATDDPDVTVEHRAILEDYAVSDAEYQGLRQELSDCLTDHGIEHTMDPAGGGLETADLPGDAEGSQTMELSTACMDGTTGPVESIYLGMRENPEGLGQGEALRRCLDDADATEYAGVSEDELERLITTAELKPTTAEAQLCTMDPFGSQGVSLDVARQVLDQEQREVVDE